MVAGGIFLFYVVLLFYEGTRLRFSSPCVICILNFYNHETAKKLFTFSCHIFKFNGIILYEARKNVILKELIKIRFTYKSSKEGNDSHCQSVKQKLSSKY